MNLTFLIWINHWDMSYIWITLLLGKFARMMNQPDRPDLINSVLYMYIFCQNKNNKFRKERSKGHTKCVATIKVQSCVKAVTDIHIRYSCTCVWMWQKHSLMQFSNCQEIFREHNSTENFFGLHLSRFGLPTRSTFVRSSHFLYLYNKAILC